jgi:hypothetical protein
VQRLSKGSAVPRLPITLKSDADDDRRRTSRETAFSPSHARHQGAKSIRSIRRNQHSQRVRDLRQARRGSLTAGSKRFRNAWQESVSRECSDDNTDTATAHPVSNAGSEREQRGRAP